MTMPSEQEIAVVLAALNRVQDACNYAPGVESRIAAQKGVSVCVEWLRKHNIVFYFDPAHGGRYKLGLPEHP